MELVDVIVLVCMAVLVGTAVTLAARIVEDGNDRRALEARRRERPPERDWTELPER